MSAPRQEERVSETGTSQSVAGYEVSYLPTTLEQLRALVESFAFGDIGDADFAARFIPFLAVCHADATTERLVIAVESNRADFSEGLISYTELKLLLLKIFRAKQE